MNRLIQQKLAVATAKQCSQFHRPIKSIIDII